MSTATPRPPEIRSDDNPIVSNTRLTLQSWWLIVLVFVAGAVSLAVEMSASRLLAPYFGTSLFVWANLIGLILLYLTIGYYLGGRIADRYPHSRVLYAMMLVAALLTSLIPLISRPILSWSQLAFATYSIGVFYGSLISVILLFALPMILLGCVSPFAIRLQVKQIGKSGRTAGQLYAISTGGSIVGTFLPVLVLIPYIGTYRTFLIFAAALFLVAVVGFLAFHDGRTPGSPKLRAANTLLSLLILVTMSLTLLGLQGPIKPASGTDGGGTLIAERESAYNYIQVVRTGNETQLVLNEGLGIHSIYNPDRILTRGPWDYFTVAPYFNNPPFTPAQVRNACVIGLGAGTIPRELSSIYGNIPIDGVEIDGEIVNLARRYFGMSEPNLHVVVQDGRYYLQTTTRKYDLIGIDAYQQPYVPFQLTTVEFFREVRAHLTSTGVAVVNAGRTSKDFRLVEALAQTMRAAFPNVYIIDTQRFANSLIVGTNTATQLRNFLVNTSMLDNLLLQRVSRASIDFGHIREEHLATIHFTDDKAPVEQLIDQMILDAVIKGQ